MSDKKILTIEEIEGSGFKLTNLYDNHEEVTLYPHETTFTVRLDNVRIQHEYYPSIVGFGFMPLSSFRTKIGDDKAHFSPYKTNYINVSLSARETAQKYIKETDKEIGTVDISMHLGDMSGNLSIDLASEYFDEVYELVKTRQLSSLTLSIIFRDPAHKLYGVHKYNKITNSLMPNLSYAVEDLEYPSGQVQGIDFATLPLPLKVDNWGNYGVNINSYDANYHSYEAYKKKKDKSIGIWLSFSSFEWMVLGLLGLMVMVLIAILVNTQ